MIKSELFTGVKEKPGFVLEKPLESKVQKFIVEQKKELNEDVRYQTIRNRIDSVLRNYNRKPKIGAAVMNCNPFTYGHQYLIETASRLVDLLYIFVVEEDTSSFPFSKRFSMVQEGSKNFENVMVVPSGEFMISTITFPGYFFKDAPTKECYDTFLDLKIFAHYIAPAFEISMRFVGEEPTDRVTAQYNQDMKVILDSAGINVIEIPRRRYNEEIISANKVRKLLEKESYADLKNYIPETTLKYLIKRPIRHL